MVAFALGIFLITLLSSINGSYQANCDDNEFTCADETCLDSFLVCDGEKNCLDGSDETKEVCSKSNIACQPFAFRCAYGACIDGDRKCDGRQDCADNSDENHPSCSGSSPTQSNTISTNGSMCQIGLYRCDSGQCIDEYMLCDGEDNCRDGTDETKEMCINFPCPSILGFQCDYGGCIDKSKRCNGINDCKDNSDENLKVCGAEPVVPLPGTGGGSKEKVIKCILKQWGSLPKHPYYPNKVIIRDFVLGRSLWESNILLLEQCFTERINQNETPDDIYGKYVSARLKAFTENEKVEIKHLIDRTLYRQFRRKNNLNNKNKAQRKVSNNTELTN